jgi:hypothetical protein
MTCGADAYCHGADVLGCRTLTVVKSGDGTGIITSDHDIECGATCVGTFTDGTKVILTAAADGGAQFMGWTGPCTGTAPCSLVVAANQDVTATFSLLTQQLHVDFLGAGIGHVKSTPAGIDCTTGMSSCIGLFDLNASVTLTATPDPAVNFIGWRGACTGTSSCVVKLTMLTQVSADFE